MAQQITYVCDNCGKSASESREYAVVYTDQAGVTLPLQERRIAEIKIDMCDTCRAYIRRANGAGMVPIRVYQGGEGQRIEFGAIEETNGEDDAECVPTSDRFLSRDRARKLADVVKHIMNEAKDNKRSMTYKVKDVTGYIIATVVATLAGRTFINPHKNGRKHTQGMTGIEFDDIKGDANGVKFYCGTKVVYIISTNLRC